MQPHHRSEYYQTANAVRAERAEFKGLVGSPYDVICFVSVMKKVPDSKFYSDLSQITAKQGIPTRPTVVNEMREVCQKGKQTRNDNKNNARWLD